MGMGSYHHQNRRRMAVEQYVFGGMTLEEIGQRFGVSRMSVCRWLKREAEYKRECEEMRQRAAASAWLWRLIQQTGE
jgi:transposase